MTNPTPPADECREAFENAMEAEYGIRPIVHPKKEYGSFQAYWYGWQAAWKSRTPDPLVPVLAEALRELRRIAEDCKYYDPRDEWKAIKLIRAIGRGIEAALAQLEGV